MRRKVESTGLGVGTVHKLGGGNIDKSLDRRQAIVELSLNTTPEPWIYRKCDVRNLEMLRGRIMQSPEMV